MAIRTTTVVTRPNTDVTFYDMNDTYKEYVNIVNKNTQYSIKIHNI